MPQAARATVDLNGHMALVEAKSLSHLFIVDL